MGFSLFLCVSLLAEGRHNRGFTKHLGASPPAGDEQALWALLAEGRWGAIGGINH